MMRLKWHKQVSYDMASFFFYLFYRLFIINKFKFQNKKPVSCCFFVDAKSEEQTEYIHL